MSAPEVLRLLLVEDCEDDAALLVRELRRGGYDVVHQRVETPEALECALEAGPWDVIIADYALPRFDGLAAFSRVQRRGLDVPFIIVSGTIGEDTAVAAMKAGVHDFLLKDRLGRLVPAVARELREARVRQERRQMQEQLLMSDRMASLGVLAASVAHEINNPLASLLLDLDFGLREARTRQVSEEGVQALESVRDCAERIREIVRDIKIFSRPEAQTFGATDLHRVMDSSVRMAWNHAFHCARIVKDYGEVPFVHASEARLGQITLNLVINAAQALPPGCSQEHEIRIVTRPEGAGWVRMEVRDTGSGIPPELRERIFEPFFTTKPSGVGTGLGLAICRRLVNEMGGSMGVEERPGGGSVFWVRLRSAQGVTAEQSGETEQNLARGQRVLVIDDEVSVTHALKRSLGEWYDVTALCRAREAMALLSTGQRFDAILCDLMMPEMSGPQFHECLVRLDPEQARRITFMTGGAFTDEVKCFLDTVHPPYIEKPLHTEQLVSLLEQRYEGRPAAGLPPSVAERVEVANRL
ncbi:response regulator [Hyalangium sp.]|uniref:response regulator n=1 Tax=Hyalangium sp. TaxID=2028555 RepID=UPI002D2C780B|nr:response regulator [Hyalangium sp.]HYH98523.1 response regulator [Hyalangium sp.]